MKMNSLDNADRPSFTQKISQMNTKTITKRPDKVIEVYSNKILGKGGYSVVFYGTLTDRNERKEAIVVAIKRTALIFYDNANREERALKKLNHPNVIRLFYAKSGCIFR